MITAHSRPKISRAAGLFRSPLTDGTHVLVTEAQTGVLVNGLAVTRVGRLDEAYAANPHSPQFGSGTGILPWASVLE